MSDRNDSIEFARRTRQNLEFILAAPRDVVHPVTQLTNSLLGMMVFPWEQQLIERLAHKRLEVLSQDGWPKWKIIAGSSKTLRELSERIRNATAHGNITFSSDSKNLSEVTLQIQDRGESGHDVVWSAQISAVDLAEFLRRLTVLIENELG